MILAWASPFNLSGFHDIPQNISVGFTDVIN